MSTGSSYKYLSTLLLSLLFLSGFSRAGAQVVGDTTVKADTAAITDSSSQPKLEQGGHQLALGVDILRPVLNAYNQDKFGLEFAADYYLKNEIYLAAEGGQGSSNVNYTDLKYSTSNNFLRFGFNKILFPREEPKDWGGMLMGLRLGVADIQRSAATYTVIDSVWGNSGGALPSKHFYGYWMELTGGVRVELWHGLLAGWNIRGKFMLNSKSFNDLSPLYIAGYGRGDKNAVFDFNFYLSYAVRWKRVN